MKDNVIKQPHGGKCCVCQDKDRGLGHKQFLSISVGDLKNLFTKRAPSNEFVSSSIPS